MKRKTLWLSWMVMSALVPRASALFEPTQLGTLGTGYMQEWSGKSSYAVNTGSGILHGHIEFAVYDTQQAGNEGLSVPGDRRYLYAYQVFNTGSAVSAAMSYFGLKDIKPGAIADGKDIDTKDAEGGVDVTDCSYNLSKTKAAFEFDGGILSAGKKSVFLVVGSDFAPVIGGYEVIAPPAEDGEISSTSKSDPIINPEPMTLCLLLGGTLIGLRKRK
jgi:hypothetical protein